MIATFQHQENTMSSKPKKPTTWNKSTGKKLLMDDLRSGAIPLSGTEPSAQEIFKMRPEFGEDDANNKKFTQRLRSARKQVNDDKSQSQCDSKSLASDRLIHPKPLTNYRGEGW
jgi:hypothetical protein